MKREMLRAKVHRITVTECDVEYEGSLTLDGGLMKLAGMVPFERIDVYDVDNGSRFSTYLIEGADGSGVCGVNGAAARLTAPGHRLIVASYCTVEEADIRKHRPKIVLVDGANHVTVIKDREEAGARVRS
jgi:aspartate 1-decarboxylase